MTMVGMKVTGPRLWPQWVNGLLHQTGALILNINTITAQEELFVSLSQNKTCPLIQVKKKKKNVS